MAQGFTQKVHSWSGLILRIARCWAVEWVSIRWGHGVGNSNSSRPDYENTDETTGLQV